MRGLERADCFDRSITGLRDRGGSTRQHRPCCGLGIKEVVLAIEMTVELLGPVDLDDLDTSGCEMTGQAGAIGASGLNPNDIESSLSSHPLERRLVTNRGRRERCSRTVRKLIVSSTAATLVSAWVSKPPVTRRRVAVIMVCDPFDSVERLTRDQRSRSGQHRDGSAPTGSYQVTLFDRGSRNVVAGEQRDESQSGHLAGQ